MLNCREVARAVASDELLTAGWRRSLAVRMHLFGCRDCRGYAAQIRAIGREAQDLFGDLESDAQTLERLETGILEHLRESRADAPELDH